MKWRYMPEARTCPGKRTEGKKKKRENNIKVYK